MTAETIPLFWTEPWRWAAPAWQLRYGAPAGDFDCLAARLIYSGWTTCFGLDRRWCPPADARWLDVVRAPPALLRGVASMLGHLAALRADATATLVRCAPSDQWFSLALKYRDVNCMRTAGSAARDEPAAACLRGARVLCAMARCDWPEIGSRMAMIVPPDTCATGQGRVEPGQGERALTIEWLDASRCLSLCAAAMRHAIMRPTRGPRQ